MTADTVTCANNTPFPTMVECVIFSIIRGQPHVALIRDNPSSGADGLWALLAELLCDSESTENVARRLIEEHIPYPESALTRTRFLQLEGRIIDRESGRAIAAQPLVAVLPEAPDEAALNVGVSQISWFAVDSLPPLVCDHAELIGKGWKASQGEWHCYRYARPMVAADCVVFSIMEETLHVALIQRRNATEKERWALPGGFLREDEPPRLAAKRELFEETGIADKSLADQPLEEIGIYGDPGRDPRGWVISTAFMTLISMDRVELIAGTDAVKAEWFAMDDLPDLAFDHARILRDARECLAGLVSTDLSPTAEVVFGFLPEAFTLAQAQQLFEIISGRVLDRGNFRKWIGKYWNLEDTGEKAPWGRHRPAALFRLIGLKV